LKKKIKPIIKWAGGKYNEYRMFSSYIPSFNRYFEPFFGSGGVYFALQPTVPSYLNDKSVDLAKFYSLMSSVNFKDALLQIASAWESADDFCDKASEKLLNSVVEFIEDRLEQKALEKIISAAIDEIGIEGFTAAFVKEFVLNKARFSQRIKKSIVDKSRRVKAISKKTKRAFTGEELSRNIETAIKSGFYLYLRTVMNLAASGEVELNKEKATAVWYFVRELCYASMFRFNSKKHFNIPYGGMAYNRKEFRRKVEKIFSKEVRSIFNTADFFNLDFEHFIKATEPVGGDFIFLDPPYDSEFSEYDQNTFTKDDQVRLRNCLVNLEAKWMMVIKKTSFIEELYDSPSCRIIEFDKKYKYNVQGRNNRDTQHLIIVNYDI
jgi:DNA adenine methylase